MKKNNIFEQDSRKRRKKDNIKGIRSIERNSGYLHQWKEESSQRKMQKLKWWGTAAAVFILVISITIFINVINLNEVKRQKQEFLAQITPVPTEEPVQTTPEPVEYSSKFGRALKMYKDVVAYLTIEDTNIDFPIVQGEDNYFFENRNYDRTYSEIAATYMLSECDPNTSRHLVIYGENSDLEGRLGNLTNFLDYDFFYTHEYITLELEDGALTWQVFSVHLASTTFNYKDVDFESNTEYLAYIKMFQTMSRFPREIDLNERDQILTLVTDYHDLDLEEGYLVIHARRIN